MKNILIFKDAPMMRVNNRKGEFELSAECELNGEFEIVISGNGGSENAILALTRAINIANNHCAIISCHEENDTIITKFSSL